MGLAALPFWETVSLFSSGLSSGFGAAATNQTDTPFVRQDEQDYQDCLPVYLSCSSCKSWLTTLCEDSPGLPSPPVSCGQIIQQAVAKALSPLLANIVLDELDSA